jgi:hypothetical protein
LLLSCLGLSRASCSQSQIFRLSRRVHSYSMIYRTFAEPQRQYLPHTNQHNVKPHFRPTRANQAAQTWLAAILYSLVHPFWLLFSCPAPRRSGSACTYNHHGSAFIMRICLYTVKQMGYRLTAFTWTPFLITGQRRVEWLGR